MHLQISNITPQLLKNSQNFFGEDFCNELKKQKPGTFNESLVARYLIKKSPLFFETSPLTPLLKGEGDYSISHKKNLVFVGVSSKKIGVDIEIIKKRDKNLLEKFNQKEYEILGEKNWKNFYILWTAKESIIKYENLKLDDIEKIILQKVEMFLGNIGGTKNISGLKFQKKLFLNFKNKDFIVYSGIKGDLVFGVCNLEKLG